MSLYHFSSVTGVLPDPSALHAPLQVPTDRPHRRAHVPAGCRPHLAWVTDGDADSVSAIGRSRPLREDGTTESPTALAPEDSEETRTAAKGCNFALSHLTTIDGATGTRVVAFSSGAAYSNPTKTKGGIVTVVSDRIPSGLRIAALHARNPIAATTVSELPIVADVKGNIYQLDLSVAADASAASSRKRSHAGADTRTGASAISDELSSARGTGSRGGQWRLLAPANSHLPSTVYSTDGGNPYAVVKGRTTSGDPFAVSRGAPGYVGLGMLPSGPLLCARGGFNDLRVIDVTYSNGDAGGNESSADSAAVVRAYGTTHRPTGLYLPAAWPLGASTNAITTSMQSQVSARLGPLTHTALVCEGCLATLFDVRCPSAVLRVPQLYQAAAVDAGASAGAMTKADPSLPSGDLPSHLSSGSTDATAAACGTWMEPLVPGRLTSTIGTVSDACGTANPMEVALAIDRALCIYDVRRFSALFTAAHVLKYATATVAATAGGRAVVCAGIDSEVRLVPLYPKMDAISANGDSGDDASAVAVLTMAGAQRAAGTRLPTPAAAVASAGGGPERTKEDPVEAFSTFRTRLNTSVSCSTTWHGGWVTCSNAGGAVAVGISADAELFVAQ